MTSLTGSPARPRRGTPRPAYPRKLALGVALVALASSAAACGAAPSPYAQQPPQPPPPAASATTPPDPGPEPQGKPPSPEGLPAPTPGEEVDMRADGTCWSLDRDACEPSTPCDPPIVQVRCPAASEDHPVDDAQVQASGG